MALVNLHAPPMTHDEMNMVLIRQDYLEGRISVERFEHDIELVLKGEAPPYLGMTTEREWR